MVVVVVMMAFVKDFRHGHHNYLLRSLKLPS
jgi:hypothetical protein